MRVRAVNPYYFLTSSYTPEVEIVALAAPSTPANATLLVVPNNQSACFFASWNAPESNGGDTSLLTYKVQISGDNGVKWKDVNNSACPMCNSLTVCGDDYMYTNYYILRVRAQATFISPYGNSSSTQFGFLPNAPTNFMVANSTIGAAFSSVTLSWQAGPINGPLVIAYTVESYKTPDAPSTVVAQGLIAPTLTLQRIPTGSSILYSLKTVNAMGTSGIVNLTVLVASVPLTPPAPPILGDVTLTSISANLPATWPPFAEAQSLGAPVLRYELEVLMNNATSSFSFTNTSAILADLRAGQSVIVRYRACNQIGCGAFSASATKLLVALPPIPMPPAVKVISANMSSQTIQIDWTPAPDIPDGNITLQYTLEFSTSAASLWRKVENFFPQLNMIPAYTTTFLAPVAKAGVNFNFRVIASNVMGDSQPSEVGSVRVINLPPRPIMGNIFVNLVTTQTADVTITWTGDFSATAYLVEQALVLDQLYISIGTSYGTRFVARNLTIGVEYQFRVTAFVSFDGGVPSDFGPGSIEVKQFIGVAPYDAPTVYQPFVNSINNGTIVVSWGPAAYNGLPTVYDLYQKSYDPAIDTSVPPLALLASSLDTPIYAFKNYPKQRYYQFLVLARNTIGPGVPSLISKSVYAGDPPQPPFATRFSAFVQAEEYWIAELAWNSTSSAQAQTQDRFTVQYMVSTSSILPVFPDTDSNDTEYAVNLMNNVPCCNALIHNVSLGTWISFRVQAINPAGYGEFSPIASGVVAKTPGAMLSPVAQSFKILSSSSAEVNVTWQKSIESPEALYRLEYSLTNAAIEKSGAYSFQIAEDSSSKSSLSLSLTTGQTYVFRVSSLVAGVYGPPSRVSTPLLLIALPGEPKDLSYYLANTAPVGTSIKFSSSEPNGAPILFYVADYTIAPARTRLNPVTGSLIIPLGGSVLNASLPSYNGWSYDVSVFAVNAAGSGARANISFYVGTPPRNAATGFDFGDIYIADRMASFNAKWTLDYFDSVPEVFEVLMSEDQIVWTVYGTIDIANGTKLNGSCSPVPFSTVMSCQTELRVPSGGRRYFRSNAYNYFGYAPNGTVSSLLLALRPSFGPEGAINFSTIDTGSQYSCNLAVAWVGVIDDGGATVTYDIEYTIDPKLVGPFLPLAVGIAPTSFVVQNVTLGPTRYFRITPKNAGGQGNPIYGSYMPSVPPDTINNLVITEIFETYVKLEFDIPANGGVPLFAYWVNTKMEYINGTSLEFLSKLPIGFANVISETRQGLTIPVGRGAFYSFSIMAVNSNKLQSRSYSNYTVSFYAAFYTYRGANPDFSTSLGGAVVQVDGDSIPWTSRFFCKFGDQLVRAIPSTPKSLVTASPLCIVPPLPSSASVPFSVPFAVTLDGGVQWTTRNVTFTYYDYPRNLVGKPLAGLLAGGTTFSVSATNLRYVQTLIAQIGTINVTCQYNPLFETAECLTPAARRVSPPTLPVRFFVDGNLGTNLGNFFYFVTPVLLSLAPTSLTDEVGVSITLTGSGFAQGLDGMIKLSNSEFGDYFTTGTYVSSTKMVWNTIPLPGLDDKVFLASLSYDGGQTYTNELPIKLTSNSVCKGFNCSACPNVSCAYVKNGQYGRGWCHDKFTTVDVLGPQIATNCSGWYITNSINPIPLAIYNTSTAIIYTIEVSTYMGSHDPGLVGPIEVLYCKGAGSWTPITPWYAFKSETNRFQAFWKPFENYVSKPTVIPCTFSVPLSSKAHDSRVIGFYITFDGMSYVSTYVQPFVLRPFLQVDTHVIGGLPLEFLNTEASGNPTSIDAVGVGMDLLYSLWWLDTYSDRTFRIPRKTCNRYCEYVLQPSSQTPGTYLVRIRYNDKYLEELAATYIVYFYPDFAKEPLKLPFFKRSEESLESTAVVRTDERKGHVTRQGSGTFFGCIIRLNEGTACIPFVDVVNKVPVEDIDFMVSIPIPPIDGEYGLKVEGDYRIRYFMDGDTSVIGRITVEIAAKRRGEIDVEIECKFKQNPETLHSDFEECRISFLGGPVFGWGWSIEDIIEVELAIKPQVGIVMYLVPAARDTKGFYVGNDLNIYGGGIVKISLELKGSIGGDIVGVKAMAFVSGEMEILYRRDGKIIDGILFSGGVSVQVCFLICTGFSFIIEWKLEFKRSVGQEEFVRTGMYLETGAYWNNFAFSGRKRSDAAFAVPHLLIEDVYNANRMSVYEMMSSRRALALSVTHLNTTAGTSLTIMYSIYDHDEGSFSPPTPVEVTDRADSSPFAVLYNSTSYLVVFSRSEVWSGNDQSNATQLKAFTQTVELVYTFYNMDTDKWGPIANLTNNVAMDFAVSMATFTQNRVSKVMAVWSTDLDGDVTTTNDKYLQWSVLSESGWTAPASIYVSTSFNSYSMKANKDSIVFVYDTTPPSKGVFNAAQILVYTIASGTWSTPANLFNSPTEMVPAPVNMTEPSSIEGSAQVVVRDNKFLITWARRRVQLFRFWSPSSQNELPQFVETNLNLMSNFAKLITFGSGTIDDPQYTALVFQASYTTLPTISMHIALMEQGSSVFGNVVEYVTDSGRSMVNQIAFLAPSATRPTPEIVQVYTDAPIMMDPVTNASYLGTNSLFFRVFEIRADVKVTAIDFTQNDENTVKVEVTVKNFGAVKSNSGMTTITLVQGNADGFSSSESPITLYSLPLMNSNDEVKFTVMWQPSANFAGFVWGFTTDLIDSSVLHQMGFPLYDVRLTDSTYSGRANNGSTIVDVTVNLINNLVFPSNITVPVSLYTKAYGGQAQTLLATVGVLLETTETISPVVFSVSEFVVQGAFIVSAGIDSNSLPASYSSSLGSLQSNSSISVLMAKRLVLNIDEQVIVRNQVAKAAVIQVDVYNPLVFSTQGTVSVYLTDLTEVPLNTALTTISSSFTLIMSEKTFFVGSSTTSAWLSFEAPVGTNIYCFVALYTGSNATENNFVCREIEFTQIADLQIFSNQVTVNTTNGTIAMVVNNLSPMAVSNIVLPVYRYIDSATNILLGYTNPFDVGSGSRQVATLVGLATEFALADLSSYTFFIRVEDKYTPNSKGFDVFVDIAVSQEISLPVVNPDAPVFTSMGISIALRPDTIVLRKDAAFTFNISGYESRIGEFGVRVLNSTHGKYMDVDLDTSKIDSGEVIVHLRFNDFLPLAPETASATVDVEIDVYDFEDDSIFAAYTLNAAVQACKNDEVICKDFTCANSAAACAGHNSLCPITRPVLIENSCLTTEQFADSTPPDAFSFTLVPTLQNRLNLAQYLVTVDLPPNAVSLVSGFDFSSISLSIVPNTTYTSTPSSIVVEIAVVGAQPTFVSPISINLPSWNSSMDASDLALFCLGIYENGKWTCVAGSTLSFSSDMSITASTVRSGRMGIMVNLAQDSTTSSLTSSTTSSQVNSSNTGLTTSTFSPSTGAGKQSSTTGGISVATTGTTPAATTGKGEFAVVKITLQMEGDLNAFDVDAFKLALAANLSIPVSQIEVEILSAKRSPASTFQVVSTIMLPPSKQINDKFIDAVAQNAKDAVMTSQPSGFVVVSASGELVYSPEDSPAKKNDHDRDVRLGVGIGIGLGLPIVVLAMVGIVLLIRRRKTPGKEVEMAHEKSIAISG